MSKEELIVLEDPETEFGTNEGRFINLSEKALAKNKITINRFLGHGRRVNQTCLFPRYYGELLTWALNLHLVEDGWQVIRTIGYHGDEPIYLDVQTSAEKDEDLLIDGQILITKGEIHLIVTIDINLKWRNSIMVEGLAKYQPEIDNFVICIRAIAKERNFYRGQKIAFDARLRFLNLTTRTWDTIVLDQATKDEIRMNSVAFLNRKDRWQQYGIPLKRGLLLTGEPGTGKTAICKAILAEAENITGIVTNAYALDSPDYITELYELAQDVSPSIVIIEDIDLIGQDREEYGNSCSAALVSLLSVLDGVEERHGIVTIATTNHLSMLDKALSERPSRFDRVIEIPKPSCEKRRELVSLISQKIPLSEATQNLVAVKSDNCTPAQLQEVVYGLVIGQPDTMENQNGIFTFPPNEIDRAVRRVKKGHAGQELGFIGIGKHNSVYEASLNIHQAAIRLTNP